MQFSVFASVPGLHYSISTREGGISQGEFSSLNLGFHVGDDAEAVRENRRRFAHGAGFDLDRLVAAQQVHGPQNRIVTSEEAGQGALDWESALSNCDALITDESNLPLLILVADCAPILLVDSRRHVLAVVHAGWRGALAGAASHAIEAMMGEFGTNPDEIKAAIGPCLSTENLEVGEEVAVQVEARCQRAVVRNIGAKPHLDLRAIIIDDLTGMGVQPDSIEISPLCPRNDNDILFSHRGQSGKAGRFGLVAWWE